MRREYADLLDDLGQAAQDQPNPERRRRHSELARQHARALRAAIEAESRTAKLPAVDGRVPAWYRRNRVTAPASRCSGSRREAAHSAHVPTSFDIVALATSAGGLKALSAILSGLPVGFPAAVMVVQHLDPRHRSLMASILSRRTGLRVKEAENGDKIEPSAVYVAPPNKHLLANPDGSMTLTHSELVHFVRPSADLLFESVAGSYRDRAIAVVLTGTGTGGAMGVRAITKVGGTVLAQDEASSEFFGMPGAAIQTGCVDFVLSLAEIAPARITLVTAGEVDERG